MRAFLEDSQYSNMEPLFIGPTVLLVSKEPKGQRDAAGPEGCAPRWCSWEPALRTHC
uniref:Uncharacterized protein n=1 Tax=Anguilla anguilla TaxID=7936 RepID=A0A0E9TNT7_ANGAN